MIPTTRRRYRKEYSKKCRRTVRPSNIPLFYCVSDPYDEYGEIVAEIVSDAALDGYSFELDISTIKYNDMLRLY